MTHVAPPAVRAVSALSVLAAVCAIPLVALAQTPQQLEYERQQREYWRAQEQQRQEQQRIQQLQLDNARRQQEEANRAMQQSAPGRSGAAYPTAPAGSSAAAPSGGTPAPASSAGSAERRYAVAGHGFFVAPVPRDWKDQVRQASRDSPPTIVFGPASGNAFQFLVTPSWPEPKGRGPLSREELRAAVERGAQSARSWSLESELPLRELQGHSGPGFYISATERAAKPGAHRFVTTGIIRVGELSVPFTLTSNDSQGSMVRQALDVLRAAVQIAATTSAAGAAPPAATGGKAPAAPAVAGTLQLQTVYMCNGERVVVQRCRSDAADAYCSVSYPDRKSAATKGLVLELAEQRGPLVNKLAGCQKANS